MYIPSPLIMFSLIHLQDSFDHLCIYRQGGNSVALYQAK